MDRYPLPFCETCPLRGEDNGPVWTKGAANAPVVVLGEAPGYHEAREGKPFEGPAGKLLIDAVRQAGFNPQQDLLFVNPVLCRPEGNADPPTEVVDACRENAIKVVTSHPRKLMICAGNFAMYAAGLTPEPKGVTAKRGQIVHSDAFDCDCLITLHPAYILRNQHALQDLVADLRRAYDCMDGVRKRPTLDVDPVVLTASNIETEGQRILDAEFVGWDTETDPNGMVFCIGFAISEKDTFYLPVWINRKAQWHQDNVQLLRGFLDKFAEHNGILSAHSASSDILWFQHTFGKEMSSKYHCTMITSHLLDETRRLGLGYLLETSMGYQNYKHEIEAFFAAQGLAKKLEPEDPEEELDSDEASDLAELDDTLDRDYTTLPAEMVKDYVCRDALATLLLDRYFEPQMNDDLRKLRDEVDQPVDLCFGRATHRGILVDRAQLKKLSDYLSKKVPELKELLAEMVGDLTLPRTRKGEIVMKTEKFNPASPPMVREWLYKRRGYPVLGYTDKTKMPSTGAKLVLVPLHKSNPDDEVLDLLLQFRTAHKNLTTYITGPKAGFHNVVGADGRVHSRFLVTSTVTARTSSRRPNLQNLPDPMPCVLVPDPGYVFVYGDLSQAELRAAQYLSGCQALLDSLQSMDVHTATASKAFKVPMEEVQPVQRSRAKTVVFGTIYGESPEHLAQSLGLHKINWQLPNAGRFDAMDKKLNELEKDEYVDQADLELVRAFLNDGRHSKIVLSDLFEAFRVDLKLQHQFPTEPGARDKAIIAVLERAIGTIEAASIQATVLQPYDGLRRYIEEMRWKATHPPHKVEGYLGRVRRLWFESEFGSKSRAGRQAANAPIQSMAADLLKQCVLQVDAELRARKWDTGQPGDIAWFILQIHDSMTFQAKEEYADEVAKLMHDAMNFKMGDVEFKAEIEVKQRLAEANMQLLTLNKELRK